MFDITLTDACAMDIMTTTIAGGINDIDYPVARDPIVVAPLYNQADALCPSSYGISLIITGVETPLTTPQQSILTLNPSNGELTIDTSDAGLIGETWTVKLYFESTRSR